MDLWIVIFLDTSESDRYSDLAPPPGLFPIVPVFAVNKPKFVIELVTLENVLRNNINRTYLESEF